MDNGRGHAAVQPQPAVRSAIALHENCRCHSKLAVGI